MTSRLLEHIYHALPARSFVQSLPANGLLTRIPRPHSETCEGRLIADRCWKLECTDQDAYEDYDPDDEAMNRTWDLWTVVYLLQPKDGGDAAVLVSAAMLLDQSSVLDRCVSRPIASVEAWEAFMTEVVLPEIYRSPIGPPPLMFSILETLNVFGDLGGNCGDNYHETLDPMTGTWYQFSSFDLEQDTWMSIGSDADRALIVDRLWLGFHIIMDEPDPEDDFDQVHCC